MLRLVHEDCRTWRLYNKCPICMLQVWVHCASISCTIACYGFVRMIFLIVIVNMEYDIIVFIVRDSVFQIWIVSAEFGSSRFCWVNFILCFFVWVRFMVHLIWRIHSLADAQLRYKSLTLICNLKLVLGFEFLTGNLDWDPQICRYGQNMFYGQIHTHVLIFEISVVDKWAETIDRFRLSNNVNNKQYICLLYKQCLIFRNLTL